MQRKGISKIYLIAGVVMAIGLLVAGFRLWSLNYGEGGKHTMPDTENRRHDDRAAPAPSGSDSSFEKQTPERTPRD